jgi:hypothetical protein
MTSTGRTAGWASSYERAVRALQCAQWRVATSDAWAAAVVAARTDDEAGLAAVAELADGIRAQAGGRVRAEAETLGAYCRAALQSLREEGRGRPRTPLARLLLGEPPRRG